MANKIRTEADRRATPPVPPTPGTNLTTAPRPEDQPGARLAHAQQEEPGQARRQGRLSPP